MKTILKCQKDKFLLNRKTAYLNCAYMSPQMKKVENAGKKALRLKRQPDQVSGADFFKESDIARSLFSGLINNPTHNRVVSIPSVSYGMANVVNNLRISKGENVVVIGDQFPSNVYPWMTFCSEHGAKLITVSAPDTFKNRGEKWNESILDTINSSTVAVSLGHVHWVDGTLFDLVNIRKKCSEFGAALIIDGTQSVGAYPFDVEVIQPDALIVATYKWLFGPYSMGMAYYGERFDGGSPIEQSWINRLGSEDFSGLVNYQEQYHEGALRYEVGEHSNFMLKPMMNASMRQIGRWKVENIQSYCHALVAPYLEEISSLGLYIEKQSSRGAHLFGIKIPEDKMEKLQTTLKVNRVSVSIRGSFMRVAPHVYNDERDMNKLLRALKSAVE
ncbi:MAG: aminotransferase class V-fold PLP-dependent enzyme [Pseudomonadales bacterium]|nr:aminotransferase class V-fold PLP-dependent enzyme [Pseudomonadales bacterium]